MTKRRVMMIGLDGFELSIAEQMIAKGRLPALQQLQRESASVLLDHGAAKRSGLAWEHISSGLSPESTQRSSAVAFDKENYQVRQVGAVTTPFPALLDRKCVVFDPPYFLLDKAPAVRGVTNWGAHDPGTPRRAKPHSLLDEMADRLGDYPAEQWIYGHCWPSEQQTTRMAEDLTRAVEARTDHILWLFGERLPDWELGIVVVSEYHSAIEAMWHGIDPRHPLHGMPSSAPARSGIEQIYEAGDRLIARLIERFPDADLVLFATHGMGPNHADAIGMVLLPELLHRHYVGGTCLGDPSWQTLANGVPVTTEGLSWEQEVAGIMDPAVRDRPLLARIGSRLHRTVAPDEPALDWMLATRYQRFWRRMPAFALPSYYDGQIRLNLKGRESGGTVAPEEYDAVCDEVETLLRECRDALAGAPIVGAVERFDRPLERGPFQADMIVEWNGPVLGLIHPRLGRIGPVPYRRTGGHTGQTGVAWLLGQGLAPGRSSGTRSAFDVVPTVIEMLGSSIPPGLSGESFLEAIKRAPPRPADPLRSAGFCRTMPASTCDAPP